MAEHFIAFDFGATSGRCISGSLEDGRLSVKELTRFPNRIIERNGHMYWDFRQMQERLVEGLCVAAKEGSRYTSIGIDTWGVDFICVDGLGNVLGMPYSYRDPHTAGMPERFFLEKMPGRTVFGYTGIQTMNFNTLFQLYAMRVEGDGRLDSAEHILFLPDALAWFLTGNMVTEYTIASTSQMFCHRTRKAVPEILDSLGLSPDIFPETVMPGTVVGNLKRELAEKCGFDYDIPVVAVAGHDTGSAVVAVPGLGKGSVYLSSGTWSLMGMETDVPVIDERTYGENITNEGGADGNVRLLKNITGMWLLERCMAEWEREGKGLTYQEAAALAEGGPRFGFLIDPDDTAFAAPVSMTEAIRQYCIRTGQGEPVMQEDYVCCIFESLALKYRYVMEILQACSTVSPARLHIIGGGSRNELLNQYAADATGLEVYAGPVEATAIGNIMIQARAAGCFDSIAEIREALESDSGVRKYCPENTGIWARALEHYAEAIVNEV